MRPAKAAGCPVTSKHDVEGASEGRDGVGHVRRQDFIGAPGDRKSEPVGVGVDRDDSACAGDTQIADEQLAEQAEADDGCCLAEDEARAPQGPLRRDGERRPRRMVVGDAVRYRDHVTRGGRGMPPRAA